MLAKLKSLLKDSFGHPEAQSEEQLQEQLKMASAILLLEVARTDHNVEEVEVQRIARLADFLDRIVDVLDDRENFAGGFVQLIEAPLEVLERRLHERLHAHAVLAQALVAAVLPDHDADPVRVRV